MLLCVLNCRGLLAERSSLLALPVEMPRKAGQHKDLHSLSYHSIALLRTLHLAMGPRQFESALYAVEIVILIRQGKRRLA